MRSRLYRGTLRHRRAGARAYRFTYGVFYCGFDLDELPEADRRLRLFSYNRGNVMSLQDRDHFGIGRGGIRAAVRERLASSGIDPAACTVTLLTNTRILGYVFNPVSFYLVRDGHGSLCHVIAEVHNTQGQRHIYDLHRVPAAGGAYAATAEKAFYVSPFIDMEARYEFRCEESADGGLDIRLDEFRDGAVFFQAQLRLAPLPMTNRNIAKMLLRYPFMTARTTALIHWQGLKLWLRGEPYRRNPRRGEVIR